MKQHLAKFIGDGVGARARRSSIWSVADIGASQGLRLASNLILTRLLYPEAFGLMALVSVVVAGLTLLSDTGIRPSIVQNARGDDPDFLNTAWTVQVVRGVFLWFVIVAIAMPMAALYDEPQLAQILPVAGLALLIEGLQPTAVYTVDRHLVLGHSIRIKLSFQAIGLMILTALAWSLQSVWALVIGNLITSILGTLAYHIFLPGLKNRFRFEPDAAKQIFQFGKWIFLSTAAAFLINQGDRAILGLYVSLEILGIYNIGYFLASIPLLLSSALQQKVMMPLYCLRLPASSPPNRAELFRARRLIALSMIMVAAALSFIGPPLVGSLYDPRYVEAGVMITLFSVSVVPLVTLSTIGVALIGAGDSRAMFFVQGMTAFLHIAFLIIGIHFFGTLGALLAPGLAILASYPLRLYYSHKYNLFDPIQDIGITALGLSLTIAACFFHSTDIAALFLQ